MAFRATLKGSGQTGIFTERAGEPPQILYITGGQFAALQGQNIQRNGNKVAILATLSSGEDGVFLGDGLTTTTIATTGDTYSAFAAAVANDAGLVAFVANLTGGGQAIVTGDGTQLTTIAATGGPFSDFTGNVSINNDGQVVFAADLAAGGRGIFTVRDGALDQIIGTGDSLFGSTVSSFADAPFSPRALNNLGQFGFLANLADGRTVWVRADPDGIAPGSVVQVASSVSGSDLSRRDGVSLFVGMTGPLQWPSMDTSALSNARFGDGGFTNDYSVAVAAGLNASAEQPATSTMPLTPPSPLSGEGKVTGAPIQAARAVVDVKRLDQFFAAGTDEQPGAGLSKATPDVDLPVYLPPTWGEIQRGLATNLLNDALGTI